MDWVLGAVVVAVVVIVLWLLLGGKQPAAPPRAAAGEGESPATAPSVTAAAPAAAANGRSAVAPEVAPRQPAADDDVDLTLLAELPEEIRMLQRGYRSAEPPAASDADDGVIEMLDETEVDQQLIDELLADDEPTRPLVLILVTGVGRTDVGRRRDHNEDCFLMLPEQHVYVVADGMGGHAGGELASSLCIQVIREAIETGQIAGEPNLLWPAHGDALARSIEMANAAIFERASQDRRLKGMGTTATAMRFSENRRRVYIAHVGDSRCYRLRGDEITQLTGDHTLAAVLGAIGKMGAKLTRAVGIEKTVEVDLYVDQPLPGDHYLLCSDGLTKMVPDDRIRELATEGSDIRSNAQRLVEDANERGGKDNITVILVRVDEPFAHDRHRRSLRSRAPDAPL